MILFAILPVAFAGWTAVPQQGAATAVDLKQLEQVLAPCPARQDTWVARFSDGKLQRFGPIAGPDLRDEAQLVRACLEAGLHARPLKGDVMVRVSWADTRLDRWRTEVRSRIDLAIGPATAPSCAMLRFPVDGEGTLGPPALYASSGDEAFDATALSAAKQTLGELPAAHEELVSDLGDYAQVCVGGRR